MADAKLNMSLDQIIESSRKREPKPKPTARKTAVSKRPTAVIPRTSGVTKRAPVTARSLKVSIVNRPPPRRNIERTTVNRHPATRAQIPGSRAPRAPITTTRPAPEGRWQHDLYAEGETRSARRQSAPKADGIKLLISNLDYRVSEDDIKELFSSVGALKSWKIQYDHSGRSEGTAEVVFVTRADAESAKQKYNNVALDGEKMVIEIASSGSSGGGSSVFSRLSAGAGGSRAGKAGLQVTRTFTQATREASTRGTRSRASTGGRMRAFEADNDYMEE